MRFLGNALDFFLSLRTAVWLLLCLLCLLLYGSFLMPLREEFSSMNAMPLFAWLREAPLGLSWWLWGAIILLSALTANTLLCSVESVVKKWSREKLLLIISPQIIHIGFLFILLAHLISSAGSLRAVAAVPEGAALMLPDNTVLKVESITINQSPEGYIADFRADVGYFIEGKRVKSDFLAPNSPSFMGGLGVYLKDIRQGAVVIEVSKEPGALWALIGGILFMTGTLMLVTLKMRQDS